MENVKRTKDIFLELQEQQKKTYEDVSLGEIGALEALLYMRGFKEDAEKIIEKCKQFEVDFIDEISNESYANNNVYNGFEIKEVKGREMFDFKKIEEFNTATKRVSEIQDTYKQAWKLAQKGQIEIIDGEWVSSDGELKPLPEYSRGKGYIKVTKQK